MQESSAVEQEGQEQAKVDIQSDRLWQDDGWNAKVIKNEDDEGWAVEITQDGNPEPVLVAPWTMGRDKKNPKPLDANSFYTWIKTASEVLSRHQQQLRAKLHKSARIQVDGAHVRVELDIIPDDDDPHAVLTAYDAAGECLGKTKVGANFKLTQDSAQSWASKGYERP
jgi:hypothetical protein